MLAGGRRQPASVITFTRSYESNEWRHGRRPSEYSPFNPSSHRAFDDARHHLREFLPCASAPGHCANNKCGLLYDTAAGPVVFIASQLDPSLQSQLSRVTAVDSDHVRLNGLTNDTEGDRVLVQESSGQRKAYLTKPLRSKRRINLHRGSIDHDWIIGKQPREIVQCSGNHPYRLLLPSLEDYIKLTPRFVTPIYPDTANVIVSQLDIHLSPPPPPSAKQPADSGSDEAPFEILEAGTGHGALTLHLARAIHGANTPPIQVTEPAHIAQSGDAEESTATKDDPWAESGPLGLPAPYPAEWRATRRAIVHTLDISPMTSLNARKTLRGFRRQVYAGDVDFHIGNFPLWLERETERRFGTALAAADGSFLNHIVLDLPDCDKMLGVAAPALRVGGKLLIWAPSITQVVDCVEKVQVDNLPLWLERALELGQPFSGGREWDIRSTISRSQARLDRTVADPEVEGSLDLADSLIQPEVGAASETGTSVNDRDFKLVCRPRLDGWTMNMGFLAVFSKMRRDRKPGSPSDVPSPAHSTSESRHV